MNDDRLARVFQQAFSQMNSRLDQIASRLSQVEQNNGRTIMEERLLPESEGLLGGKRVLSSENGGIQKLTYIAVCDFCNTKLDEASFIVCNNCGKKVCGNCAVSLNSRNICPCCFTSVYPITKQGYQLLVMLLKGISETWDMVEMTGISEEELTLQIKQLFESGYIVREGLSIFSKIIVNERGITASIVHSKLLSRDVDIIQFHERLKALGEQSWR